MAKQSNKLTRQGVLDLDAKYGKVKTTKRDEVVYCRHPNAYKIIGGQDFCPDCNTLFLARDQDD